MSILNEYWTVYGRFEGPSLSYDNEEVALDIARESVSTWSPVIRVVKSTLVKEFRLEDGNPTQQLDQDSHNPQSP
jgi:hypothetical protein